MVATISARGSAKAALAYYSHLGADNYYTRDGEPPGSWAGEGAEQLSLEGPVTRHEFEAALNGRDPKTGMQLAAHGGRSKTHAAGWDITFSSPKSVSVLWALSDEKDRRLIETAQEKAVIKATKFLEQSAVWARRGEGGRIRERTAGLLTAQFDHHTSRDLDPQLHTHVFVFNLAPRMDGSWGAIVSRELYKSQKQAGLQYRAELARELERDGFAVEKTAESFRMSAIPERIERAFSKRRQAIEEAAKTYGYQTPKGMELANIRTRKSKEKIETRELISAWKNEAKALGFELKPEKIRAPLTQNRRESAPVVEIGLVQNTAKSPAMAKANSHSPQAKIAAQIFHLMSQIARLAGPTHHGASARGPRLHQRRKILEPENER
jgi:conjugative relaxase-like TrwC/TraI family protein